MGTPDSFDRALGFLNLFILIFMLSACGGGGGNGGDSIPEDGNGTLLLNEGFDDNSFASRGWFDDTSVDIDTATK
jgi:hypothetical protein